MQEIIIKYRRRMIFSEEEFTVFEKIGLVGNRGDILLSGKEISKKEAMRVIKENGLVLVHDDKSGQIWDTPDKQFREKYRRLKKEATPKDHPCKPLCKYSDFSGNRWENESVLISP